MLSRRKFLSSGFKLFAGGLFIPQIVKAPPSLSFYGKTKGSGSNGLLNGLTHYWPMNEASNTSRLDSVGSLTLLDMHSNVPRVTGILNGAASFSGSGLTALSLYTSNSHLFKADASFSFQLWINERGNGAGPAPPFIGNSDQINGCQFAFVENGCGGGCHNASIFTTTACNAGIQAQPTTGGVGNWTHYIIGYDGSLQKAFAYKNAGSIVYSASTGAMNMTTWGYLFFGNNIDGGSQSNTYICEVGYWNRALSATDTTNLYNGGAALPLSSFTT